jgi:hypothetical protein
VAPTVAGRVRIPPEEGGGLLDRWAVYPWDVDDAIAVLDLDHAIDSLDENNGTLRLLMLAGRRMSWAVDSDTALLPGWNAHARAWWGDVSQGRSLLSLGLCDAADIVRGVQFGFVELFASATFPAHVTQLSEHPIAFCSRLLVEQQRRTPAQREAIAADVMRGLADLSGPAPTPEDLFYAGAFLRQLNATPITDEHACLTDRHHAGEAGAGNPAVARGGTSEPAPSPQARLSPAHAGP